MPIQFIAHADITNWGNTAPPWTMLAKAVEEVTLACVFDEAPQQGWDIPPPSFTTRIASTCTILKRRTRERTSEPNQGVPNSGSWPLNFNCWLVVAGRGDRCSPVRPSGSGYRYYSGAGGGARPPGRWDDGTMSWPWSGLGARRKITKLPPKPAANPQARKRASRGDLSRTSFPIPSPSVSTDATD